MAAPAKYQSSAFIGLSIFLNKMSVMDLSTYGLILKTVDEMEKPNYAESITSMMASLMPVCAGKSANESEVYGIG